MGHCDPARTVDTGGRSPRTGPYSGHIYDPLAITSGDEDGAKRFATCRQQAGCANDISTQAVGMRGRAALNSSRRGLGPRIEAGETWHHDGPPTDVHQAKHDALFASIRRGKPINNGGSMARSTRRAIMGRMATSTGEVITWEQALSCEEKRSSPRYDWGLSLPVPPVAIPGLAEFA
ncbi:hypothetical protein [Tautonia marina]|uniref:hypothetical protein n=1 Tax=Tautonia marina TaxID=2653855 RepID=UPI0012608E9F|nr:hypothetical protein [Tautonia marina]